MAAIAVPLTGTPYISRAAADAVFSVVIDEDWLLDLEKGNGGSGYFWADDDSVVFQGSFRPTAAAAEVNVILRCDAR